jgi:hypothetical protein
MSNPISTPTNTLLIDKPSADVNEAIAFIPALSSKYKLANANPALQMYTFSGEESSSAGVYIDVHCVLNKENMTEVTLAVRRKTGSFEKSSEVSMANQHLNTLVNLLSDSLRLEPDKKSRLLSTRTNELTAGEDRAERAMAKMQTWKERNTFFNEQKWLVYLVSFLLLATVLYVLYRYYRH